MSFSLGGDLRREVIDWLPEDFRAIRSESTPDPDVFLIQGLTSGSDLEYRTISVNLSERVVLSDEVTDEAGAGFIAEARPKGSSLIGKWKSTGSMTLPNTCNGHG